MEAFWIVVLLGCLQMSLVLAMVWFFDKHKEDQLEQHEKDKAWIIQHLAGIEWQLDCVQHEVRKAVHEIDAGGVESLNAYHECRLLPALTLLASQRVDCAPPQDEVKTEEQAAPVRPSRAQLAEDEIQNIWDKVKATP